jgi:hypothetical protein
MKVSSYYFLMSLFSSLPQREREKGGEGLATPTPESKDSSKAPLVVSGIFSPAVITYYSTRYVA